MPRVLPLILVALLALTARPAVAQLPFGLPATGSAAPEPEAAAPAAGNTAGAEARALIGVLQDDTARAALIAELERLAEGGASGAGEAASADGAAAPPGPDAAAAAAELEPEPAQPTVGEQLATLTSGLVDDIADQGDAFMRGVRATWRRLSVLWGPRVVALEQPLRDLALIVVVTVALYAALRWLMQRLYRATSRTLLDYGTVGRIGLGVVGAVLDVVALALSYAAGNTLVFAAQQGAAGSHLTQSLYLNAFVIVELIKVVLGFLIQPKRPEIRVLPFSDGPARYWTSRTGWLASILGYGLMLAVPVVDKTVSYFTARAVSVVVLTVTLLWAMALVVRHRKRPRAWMALRSASEGGPDAAMRLSKAVLAVWHWLALAYLLALFVLAVEAGGNIGPFLAASVRVAAALAVGSAINVMLLRLVRRGIDLPESVTEMLPLLQERLNTFLRSLLGALRLIVALATIAAAIDLSGAADVPRLLDSVFGRDLGITLFSVGLVIVITFLIWLGLASWVDYRLSPGRAVAATAREATLLTLLRNAVTIALVIITTMVTLSELGLDIAPLLASAGVLGLAIGFGSQRLVQDIITGIFIQFEAAMNVGDVVTVGGTTGVVEKLTIRSVSLRDLQGVFHIIPFSSVDMVSNYMKDFSFHVADIGIAYREDVTEAKDLMFKAFGDLREMPEFARVIIGPLDWHGVATLGDSAVTLRARIRTRPGHQWAVGRAYNEAVKRRFDEAGLQIPYPHMTVWFGENKGGGAPPVHVLGEQAGKARAVPPPDRPISTTPTGQDAPNEAEGADGPIDR